ncbi:MAG: DUF4261 domain-containing protein [Clostridiales bacterium]|nr:DUF4261 domain-containing protein [Clostridiales bacterium]
MGIFSKKKEKVIDQDLKDDVKYNSLFMIQLLFFSEPKRPDVKEIEKVVRAKFGDIDVVSKNEHLLSFAVKKYKANFKEGSMPPQILMYDVAQFKQESIDEVQRTQLWQMENGVELLEKCTHSLIISDMMASTMDYKERGNMLMDWLEAALELLPTSAAVWIPSAGKLFTAEMVKNHEIPYELRFLYFCVNARYFRIANTEDILVDTLGMYSLGLPDIQFHFHGLEAIDVVNHAYDVAAYVYKYDAPIKNGETIDGLKDGIMSKDVQWKCQYENSLIKPIREVIDICPGEYASGNRN